MAVQPGCGRTRGQAHRGGRSAGLSFIALATLLLTDDCTPDRGIYRYMHDACFAVGARIRITVVSCLHDASGPGALSSLA